MQKANTLTFKMKKIYHLRSNQIQARRQIGHSNIEIIKPKLAQDKVDPNEYETINYINKDENDISIKSKAVHSIDSQYKKALAKLHTEYFKALTDF